MKTNIIGQPTPKTKLNTSHSLCRGLVGYWLFNEYGGNYAEDSSGFSKPGVLTNGPLFTNFGHRGRSIKFDGSNDYVVCTNNDQTRNFTGAFTLSAWIYVMGFDGTGFGQIIMKNTTNSNYYGLVVQGTTLYFQCNAFTQTAANTISLNTWYHVVGYRNTLNQLRTVVNGVLLANSGSNSTSVTSTSDINIGRDPINGRYFNGYIQNVTIHNRLLTENEILTLYRAPYLMFMGTKGLYQKTNRLGFPYSSGYLIG